jgi:hypothetical protein
LPALRSGSFTQSDSTLLSEEWLGGPRASVDVLEKKKWPAGNRTTIFRSFITCYYTDFAMQSKSNGTFLSLGTMSRFIELE